MPQLYDKLGIRFQYPDNWTLDEKDALNGENSVTAYSPDEGAFWSVVVHPRSQKASELAKAALKVMKDQYEQLDSELVRETLGGQELIGYDLNFYCLDLTNTGHIRTLRTSRHTCLILCQAEDREYAQLEPVFRAMTASLAAGLD